MKQPKIHKIYNPAMECMDREKLRELQGKRLRETVELEYANVPLYRERMDAMGVKPSDINSVDDLKKLPFMEKTDLRDQFPYGLLAQKLTDIVRFRVRRERPVSPLSPVTRKMISKSGPRWLPALSPLPAETRTTSFRSATATASSPAASAHTRAHSASVPLSSRCRPATPSAK